MKTNKNKLTIYLQGGMCNYLRVLFYHLSICRKKDLALDVIWSTDRPCQSTTSHFLDCFTNLEGVNFSCIMIENENEKKIKMSFRSQGKFSVNSFARIYFNGGGHNNAAGGYSLDSLESTIVKFKKALEEIRYEF